MSEEAERLGYSVRGLANWVLDYADELGVHHTNMGVNKLVFFAVEHVLNVKGLLLTDAKIEAWEHGPVFREIYQSFKSNGNGFVKGRARRFSSETETFEEVAITLSLEHNAFLREALRPLMSCSAAELRALSHRVGGAWHKVWWYEGRANPGMEISPSVVLESWKGTSLEKA